MLPLILATVISVHVLVIPDLLSAFVELMSRCKISSELDSHWLMLWGDCIGEWISSKFERSNWISILIELVLTRWIIRLVDVFVNGSEKIEASKMLQGWIEWKDVTTVFHSHLGQYN